MILFCWHQLNYCKYFSISGASVGVIIPEALPNTERARLQGLLNCFTDLRTVTRAEPETATETEALEEFTEEERREAAEHAEERRASTQISKTIVTGKTTFVYHLHRDDRFCQDCVCIL